jgi:hypothetical protein
MQVSSCHSPIESRSRGGPLRREKRTLHLAGSRGTGLRPKLDTRVYLTIFLASELPETNSEFLPKQPYIRLHRDRPRPTTARHSIDSHFIRSGTSKGSPELQREIISIDNPGWIEIDTPSHSLADFSRRPSRWPPQFDRDYPRGYVNDNHHGLAIASAEARPPPNAIAP